MFAKWEKCVTRQCFSEAGEQSVVRTCSGIDCPGLHPESTASELCELGLVAGPLCALGILPGQKGDNGDFL